MKRMLYVIVFLLALTLLPMEAAAESGVEVGGIHILKTDVTGKPLEGAVFQVVRRVEPEEMVRNGSEKQLLKTGEENQLVETVWFWPGREMEGGRQREVSTNREGRAAVYGLPYGTYYLVETQAPEGYHKIAEPIRLSIHRYSHLTQADGVEDDDGKIIDNTLHIINVRYALPDTGSLGWFQLAAGATGILFSSFALLLLKRGRR